LSHAVQIYAYELYHTLAGPEHAGTALRIPDPVPGQRIPMTRREIDALVTGTCDALAGMGFYRRPGREEQERFLRDMIARAGLSRSEGRYLENIITKAGRLSAAGPNSSGGYNAASKSNPG
jgi:tRNA/rRNA methyltransferase/tRNA (cytidine32/uridine32-2'-O)-methyltransferase